MTDDEYIRHLGGLVANYHSLEFALRGFLQDLPTARSIGIPYGTDIYSFPVGTDLPENDLTSFDSLGQLIDKFNSEMKKRGLPGIDRTLVEIRDAIAHGRVSASSPNDTMRLLKYGKPVSGRVRVAFNEKLTKSWFEAQTKRTREAILFVAKYLKKKP